MKDEQDGPARLEDAAGRGHHMDGELAREAQGIIDCSVLVRDYVEETTNVFTPDPGGEAFAERSLAVVEDERAAGRVRR